MGRRKQERRERIFVGVPCMGASVNFTVAMFCEALKELTLKGSTPWEFVTSYLNGMSPVHYARNLLVKQFLQSGCDRLWFIDSDMLPKPSIFQLLSIDSDIVSGCMYRFDHENPEAELEAGVALCAFMRNPKNGKHWPLAPRPGDPAVQEVDAVGTGSMLIRRKVLEDERMWLPGAYTNLLGETVSIADETDDPKWAPPLFQIRYKPNGQPIVGEDIDFCTRAKALGYTVKVDLSAEIGHYKSLEIDQAVKMACAALRRKDADLVMPHVVGGKG